MRRQPLLSVRAGSLKSHQGHWRLVRRLADKFGAVQIWGWLQCANKKKLDKIGGTEPSGSFILSLSGRNESEILIIARGWCKNT